MMFELGIFSVILLAAGYWATLWIMGRRDDVLHGKFVHPETEADIAAGQAPPPFPARPSIPVRPARREASDTKRVNSDALESLLAAIKQDLKDVA
jgi:hypothetical protein